MTEQFLGILFPIIFILLSSYIIWKSTDSFAVAADYLGRNMSRGVKGATINAVASSMPEFLTTMFFLFTIKNHDGFSDSFSGGLGVTAGSAIFNILIIPFAILFFGTIKLGRKSFTIDRKIIQRDGLFLVLSNIILIVVISQDKLNPFHGLILIFIYFLYLSLLWKDFGFKNKKKINHKDYNIPSVDLNLLYFLKLDLKHILLNGRKLNFGLAWMTVIISTIIMSMGSWLLVVGTEFLGSKEYDLLMFENLKGLDLPLIFLSVLLASAATSIPDTMISVRDAKKGNYDDSISNALGSNIFDISFALGLPLFVFTIIHGEVVMSPDVRIWSITVWLLMLLINFVITPVFIYSKKISRRTGIFLLLMYFLFVFFIIEENSRFSWVSSLIESLLDFFNW